jgi:hypothetical protein
MTYSGLRLLRWPNSIFGAIGILLPAVRPTGETGRPGHAAGPRWRAIRRSRNTCGCRATSRRLVRWTGRAAPTDPPARPGKARGESPETVRTCLDDGATSVACWHRANPALEPKVAIFATRPYPAGTRHNGAKRVDCDEADLSPGGVGAQRPLTARIVCFQAQDPSIQTWPPIIFRGT